MDTGHLKTDVFISYASEDRESVRLLATAFENNEWDVWWDNRIPTGKIFQRVIEEALDKSCCVVVAWSAQSVISDWVHIEAAEGLRRNVLVPILLEDIDVVNIPLQFRSLQSANLANWKGNPSSEDFRKLIRDIKSILDSSEDIADKRAIPVKNQHVPIGSTINTASYWKKHEYIVQADVRNHRLNGIFLSGQPICYLRIWPETAIPRLSGGTLEEKASIKPLQYQRGGSLFVQNDYGCICFCHSNNNITGVTQVFVNGEIWGIDATPFGELDTERGRIATVKPKTFQLCVQRSLEEYIDVATTRFHYPRRIAIEAGFSNIKGTHHLYVEDSDSDWIHRNIFEDVQHQQIIESKNHESINGFLLTLFNKLFDAARMGRPRNYGNFPSSTE